VCTTLDDPGFPHALGFSSYLGRGLQPKSLPPHPPASPLLHHRRLSYPVCLTFDTVDWWWPLAHHAYINNEMWCSFTMSTTNTGMRDPESLLASTFGYLGPRLWFTIPPSPPFWALASCVYHHLCTLPTVTHYLSFDSQYYPQVMLFRIV